VTVRYAKRGRTRVAPLDDNALEAIVAWVKSRPPAATEHLLLSMPRAGAPGPARRARHRADRRPSRCDCPTCPRNPWARASASIADL
jgi:integrase